jgi:hypothetical protein
MPLVRLPVSLCADAPSKQHTATASTVSQMCIALSRPGCLVRYNGCKRAAPVRGTNTPACITAHCTPFRQVMQVLEVALWVSEGGWGRRCGQQ